MANAEIRFNHTQRTHGPADIKALEIKSFLQPLSFIEETDPEERWLYYSRVVLPYDLYIPASSPTTTNNNTSTFLSHQQRISAIENEEVVKFAEGHLDMDNKDSIVTSTRKLFYLHINYIRLPTGLILEATEKGFERVGVASIFAEEDRYLICPERFKRGIESTDVLIV